MESIYKSNWNAKLEGLGSETKWSGNNGGKHKRFNIEKVKKLA